MLTFQATGEDFSVEPSDTRRPFRALLDVGLVKTTTGNRVFGALKVLLRFCYSFFSNENEFRFIVLLLSCLLHSTIFC